MSEETTRMLFMVTLEILGLLISTVAAIVTAWMAVETRKMAKASNKVAELEWMPILGLKNIKPDFINEPKKDTSAPNEFALKGIRIAVELFNAGRVPVRYKVNSLDVTFSDRFMEPELIKYSSKSGQHFFWHQGLFFETAINLIAVFDKGMQALQTQCLNPFERAGAFFLFGALQKFFSDGTKRTSRLMMNGMMMSQGLHALSISAATLQEFNEHMVHFYKEKNATAMFGFLARCHPDYPLRNTP